MVKNKEIRGMLSVNGITQKELAEEMKILPTSLNRMLREELTTSRKAQVIKAIQIIKGKREKK